MAVATRKSRRLLPGEDPTTASFETARRWLTIYEQRESLLARNDLAGRLSPEDFAAVAAGAAYWRQRTVELSGLDLDSDRRMLRPGTETEVSLTRRELELLEFLAQHPRHYFPDHVLAVRAWGERLSGDQVRIYVRRLRSKLEGTGWELNSKRGSGYALEREVTVGHLRHPSNGKLSRDKVEQAIGRARALMAAQRTHLDQAQSATLRLRSAIGGTEQKPA